MVFIYRRQHRWQQRIQQRHGSRSKKKKKKTKVEQEFNKGKINEVCLNQNIKRVRPFLPHFQTSRRELRQNTAQSGVSKLKWIEKGHLGREEEQIHCACEIEGYT